MLSWQVGEVRITRILELEADRRNAVHPAAGDAGGGADHPLA